MAGMPNSGSAFARTSFEPRHGKWSAARSHDDVENWIPNYRDLGRGDLTAAELRKRHSARTERLLKTL